VPFLPTQEATKTAHVRVDRPPQAKKATCAGRLNFPSHIKIGLMIPLVGNQSRINSTDRIGQYPKGYEDSLPATLIPLKKQDH
jgi:hypothetical protein